MTSPEMMHIIVNQYQESLRSLAREEPLVPETGHLAQAWRRYLGTAMIRLGSWLEGRAPAHPQPPLSTQET